MTSLKQLLTEEGFGEGGHNVVHHLLSKHKSEEGITLPPPVVDMDEVAARAVMSILSEYAQQFLQDERIRRIVREKCYAMLDTRPDSNNSEIITKLKLGMDSIERLVQEKHLPSSTTKLTSLKNLITLLTILASLSGTTTHDAGAGVPNSHVCACAHLYLSFLYKLLHNMKQYPNIHTTSRICARHLLQVFSVSPFLARTHLLPHLWDRFFLPHLLHFNVWLSNQLQVLSSTPGLDHVERQTKTNAINSDYNHAIDLATKRLALHFNHCLKFGLVTRPAIPSLSLPSSSSSSMRINPPTTSFQDFTSNSHININKNLYQQVFGPTYVRPRTPSMDLDRASSNIIVDDNWGVEEQETGTHEDKLKRSISLHIPKVVCRRSSSQDQDYTEVKSQRYCGGNKSGYSRFLFCRTQPSENNATIMEKPSNHLPSTNFSSAIHTICNSDSLSDCEMSMRVIAKTWLDSQGGPLVEATLSKAPVIEGMLDVLSSSNDEEILEILISIAAELVSRSKANREIVLNADPQLQISARLLRSSSLFLKSSVLIYLLKPEAKHMVSVDWIPLVLRILEFGDQFQTLFTVQCSPQVAAFYLLEQLLTNSDMDRNMENARKVVSLGGLNLLLRRLETGNENERSIAALYISTCIKADGNCRYYIAKNVNKFSILNLLRSQNQGNACALSLLADLLCLNRRTEITNFLNALKNEGGCSNTMNILLVYLQHAPLEQRPLVAAILLQLDLLGDHLQSSLYREEVVDAIVEALDCKICNEKVQEQSGRALLLLGGHFSYVGDAVAETWLLKKAGYGGKGDSFHGNDINAYESSHLIEEEDATEEWLRKTTTALLMSGNKRLLTALSVSMANAIPFLSGASLITIAWISWSLRSIKDEYLQSLACSIFVPQLLENLNYDRQIEKRVLASLSLLSLIKNSENVSKYVELNKDIINYLRNLSLVTWTAEELLPIAMNGLLNSGY